LQLCANSWCISQACGRTPSPGAHLLGLIPVSIQLSASSLESCCTSSTAHTFPHRPRAQISLATCLAPVLETTAPHSFPFPRLVTHPNRDLRCPGSALELLGAPSPRQRSLCGDCIAADLQHLPVDSSSCRAELSEGTRSCL